MFGSDIWRINEGTISVADDLYVIKSISQRVHSFNSVRCFMIQAPPGLFVLVLLETRSQTYLSRLRVLNPFYIITNEIRRGYLKLS